MTASRVLFVAPNLPYPLATGGHLRDWQLLNLLVLRGVRPALLWFGAGEGRLLGGDDPVSRLCASVSYGGARVERPDRTRWATVRRKLGYLAGTRTDEHPFAYQYDAMAAHDVIVREAVRVGADVVVLRGFWCHQAARLRVAGLRVIANCPDSNVRLAREMVRSVRGPLAKLGPLCNLAAVRRQERHLADCDEIWAPTRGECEEIAARAGDTPVLTVPNVVDVAARPDLARSEPEEPAVLFVGTFDYAPNRNAARMLLESVFPGIRRALPGARLLLVGRGLPRDLAHLAARQPGVEAPGWVDELLPWYQRAALVLLPVREGAGMLFKTIEALALGKPTVGVPEAFRGIEVGDEAAPFVVAPTGPALVREALRVLVQPTRARRLAVRARAFAEARLSFEYGVRCLDGSVLADASAAGRRVVGA